MIVLVITDMAGNKAKLKFRSFAKAAEHARLVIVPQVADALENMAVGALEDGIGQQDPEAWKRTAESLAEILRELYQPEQARVVAAVGDWMGLAEDDHAGDTWVEWVEP